MKNIFYADFYKLKHNKVILYSLLFLTIIIISFGMICNIFFKNKIFIINEIIISNLDKVLIFTILFSNLFYETFKYNTFKNIFILNISVKDFFICGIIEQFIIVLLTILYFSILYFIGYIMLNFNYSDLFDCIQSFSIKLIHFLSITLAIISINNCIILLFRNDIFVFLGFLIQCNLNVLIDIFNKLAVIKADFIKNFTITTQINFLSTNTIDQSSIINSIIICFITSITFNIVAYYIYIKRIFSL